MMRARLNIPRLNVVIATGYILSYWLTGVFGAAAIALGFSLVTLTRAFRVRGFECLIILYCAASFFATDPHSEDLVEWLQAVGFPALLAIFFSQIRLTERSLHFLILALTLSTCVLTCWMYFQSAPGIFTVSIDSLLTRDRNQGFLIFGEAKLGATVIGPVILVAIIGQLSLIGYSLKRFWLKGSSILILVVMLITIGGRTAAVATTIVLLSSMLLYNYHRPLKHSIVMLCLVALVVPWAVMTFGIAIWYQPESFLARWEALWNLEIDRSLSIRLELWDLAWRMIKENPMGHGPSLFLERNQLTTHNEVLGQAVAYGVVPALLYVWLLVGSGARVLRIALQRRGILHWQMIASGLFLAGTVIGLTENFSASSGNVFNPVFWIGIGLVTNWPLKREQNGHTRESLRSVRNHDQTLVENMVEGNLASRSSDTLRNGRLIYRNVKSFSEPTIAGRPSTGA